MVPWPCIQVPVPLKTHLVKGLFHVKCAGAEGPLVGMGVKFGDWGVISGGRIIGRLECGRTQLEVSEELGITQSVISRLWQRFQDDGNVSRCYSTGRP
ncbi:HTH_Tnp_Tc3_2 domain-containing protein [Trichonephila clavipes]|nr:HTH_Tnp_Tc3_2 domain-containing protein [Trichonephila clavipes]